MASIYSTQEHTVVLEVGCIGPRGSANRNVQGVPNESWKTTLGLVADVFRNNKSF